MIHPLLRLAATEPHLLGDHVEAYAALVGEEVTRASTSWAVRIALYVVALAMVGVGLVLIGVSLLVVSALPTSGYPAAWGLIVVPVALALIFLLLYSTFGSLRLAALIYLAVPMAATESAMTSEFQ